MKTDGDLPGLTASAAPLTELMLEVFRLNGRLLQAGDALTAPVGLTSARWQVLGAMRLAGEPRPVAHLARRMGLTRQAVQRVVNDLADAGMIRFRNNPDHRRAKLVEMTDEGRRALHAALARHVPWANALADGLEADAVAAAAALLRTLIDRLDRATNAEEDPS